MNVAVVGQGYVGLPLAIASSGAGHFTIGIDLDENLVKNLNSGISPIEDISSVQLLNALNSNRYQASEDFNNIKNCDIVIVCVPTPLTPSNSPDLSYLEKALSKISESLANDTLVIVESTISPGTTRNFVSKILESSGVPYELAYSPERIDPGNKLWNISNTPKLVAGMTSNATERAVKFYTTFIEKVIAGTSLEVIEAAKLLENTFRLINISFMNEFAELCWKMKIDVRDVIAAAASKPYGFMPFYPGLGIGGHCIPIDPLYLAAKAREIGANTSFIDLASKQNNLQPIFFTKLAREMLGELQNKRILIVGVAYKPDISDTRESPAFGLVRELRNSGAKVFWHDDLVKEWMGENSSALSEDYDLAILANPHTETDLSKLSSVRIINARGGYL